MCVCLSVCAKLNECVSLGLCEFQYEFLYVRGNLCECVQNLVVDIVIGIIGLSVFRWTFDIRCSNKCFDFTFFRHDSRIMMKMQY